MRHMKALAGSYYATVLSYDEALLDGDPPLATALFWYCILSGLPSDHFVVICLKKILISGIKSFLCSFLHFLLSILSAPFAVDALLLSSFSPFYHVVCRKKQSCGNC